jgi:hypothetical protein
MSNKTEQPFDGGTPVSTSNVPESDARSTHTQGPWIIQQLGDEMYIGTPKQTVPDDVYSIVASVEGGSDNYNDAYNARQRANARLIAAAPELLEALREVMVWIKAWSPSFVEDAEWGETEQKVMAAIAKAEGR